MQVLLHKSRDWIAKRLLIRQTKKISNVSAAQNSNLRASEKQTEINQTSNFEPLASTIGGGSRITFGDSLIETLPSNNSTIYY